MWCYQKPGFEALVLAELQKQQQSSQFCDTFLKADGVSVPAHSCVLSAISSQFSSSLSSLPAAAAGQKKLLDFGTLGACTLLHLVKLLYSGMMVGEGEKEKQEAISAAAKLGIHGLVEVSNTASQQRKPQDECLYREVGVQTESQIAEEHQVRLGGWRREVRDGATLLWREKLPAQGTEMWTQTEDIQVSCASLSHPPVSYETIDLNALQSLGHSDTLQIPFVHMPVVYPNEDNHSSGKAFITAPTQSPVTHYSSVQTNVLSVSNQATSHAEETSNWGPEVNRVAAMEEWPEEGFEQFEGNIPGFINYFLNPENEELPNRKPGRRRQRAGVGGSRQVGTRLRGRLRTRRGGLMQTVDVQTVGVSKLSKMYLERWGMPVNRTGQGGGTVGRKLYVKSRESVKSGRCAQRRRGRGIEWNLDQCATILVKTEAGMSGRPRRGGLSQQHQTTPVQRSHGSQKFSKAPPARRPDEQPEQIDDLLEEVMMGLDILPSNHKKSQVPSSTSHCDTANACPVKNKRKQTSMVTMASMDGNQPSSEVPVLQQPQEGELTDILDQFLQSFERLDTVAAQSSTQSSHPHTSVIEHRKTNVQLPVHSPRLHSAHPAVTPTLPKTSIQSETSESLVTSVRRHQSKKHSGKASPAIKRSRIKRDYLLSLEKPRTKTKKTTASETQRNKLIMQRATRQLQQMPVVKLEWRGTLPENISVLKECQSPVLTTKRASSNTSQWGTKTYPIRSRFKELQIDPEPFLEVPYSDKTHRRKHSQKVLLPLLSERDSTLTPVEDHVGNNEDQSGPDNSEPNMRGMKRCLVSDVQTSEVKRVFLNPPESISQNTYEEELIDVETVSQSSTGITGLTTDSETLNEEAAPDADAESSDIDMDSDFGELTKEHMVHAEVICSLRANIVTEASDTEDLDDEVDVTGGSSPDPTPVLISWTDCSDVDNDSELDTPEEQTDGDIIQRQTASV